jgi:hypothetical protein
MLFIIISILDSRPRKRRIVSIKLYLHPYNCFKLYSKWKHVRTGEGESDGPGKSSVSREKYRHYRIPGMMLGTETI